MAKRVAVIGAGLSGLAAVKCCLEEGLEPTCFEQSKDLGGLWRFTEEVEDARASIYRSLVSNTSKEMMAYSDFPFPEDFPTYLHNAKVLDYLRRYAEQFGLLKYIQFKTKVCGVRRRPDFLTTGQWEVITETEGEQDSAVFHAVLVCAGHHAKVNLPLESFSGIERYKGSYCHSREYKNPKAYEGRRVLVVGLGNSAADLAVEVSRTAAKVFLSTRHGSWVLTRVADDGYPIDMIYAIRFQFWVRNHLPKALAFWIIEKKMNQWFNHANYGLQPKDRSTMTEPVVNDFLPSHILSGAVTVKPKVSEFGETWASFEDNTREEIDDVIFATGYIISYEFLQEMVLQADVGKFTLYKNVFSPSLEKPTLAFIGLVRPLGPIPSTAELQARWAVRVFKGMVHLPSSSCMINYIHRMKEERAKWFGTGKSQIPISDYISYLDEVADEIGVRPSLSLFLNDFKLATKVFFGPCTPYQYRLTGPGVWKGARQAILTQWERTVKPTKTRVVHESPKTAFSWRLLMIIGLLALALGGLFSR
ncbi:dimethylaniline monooxygenase [N-oxide-forming] 2-like [Ambystoma mexicanum]|uniref:dimethylaniline monooxygenase [N-oxide-forming] 2-like n=1 Tax=Ambystoma mexicanum TaxID=8296 RepID=UPI0037E946FC